MPTRVLVLGHSFIARFKSFLRDNVSKFTFSLNLDPKQFMIQYFGRAGATVFRIRRNLEIVGDFEPSMVILEICSNDLCNSMTSAEEVAGSIYALAEHIGKSFKAQTVIIMQILHRLPPSRPVRYSVDIEWFNNKVNLTNTFLKYLVEDNPNIKYWKHKGLFNAEKLRFAMESDSVRLNQTIGFPNFFKKHQSMYCVGQKNLMIC